MVTLGRFKGTINAKGSKKQTGNISDNKLSLLLGIPIGTLRDWKKSDKTKWRYRLYISLKGFREDELKEFLAKGEQLKKICV